jgi:hypothetical protein
MHDALDKVADRGPLQEEIAKARKRLAELEQQARESQAEPKVAKPDRAAETRRVARRTAPNPKDSEPADWVWGAAAIGQLIGRSESQVYYLFSQGHFGDAVWKLSRKHLVASRVKLVALPDKLAAESLNDI